MFRTARTTVLLSIAALGIAACGSDAKLGAVSTTSAETSAAPSTASTPSADPTTTAAAMPTKIVSLSPTATEMLFAIGAGDQVIAVDDQSNYPAEALAKKTTLSGFTPNVEAIAKYQPDLVVIEGSTDLDKKLAPLGIATWTGAAASTFDDIYREITELGAVTGHATEAAALVTDMKAKIDAAVASVPKLTKPPSYYHELDNTLFSVTSNTFIGEVYGLFGLRNIADAVEGDNNYPQLNAEFIVSQNPDLVFLADTKCCGETPATVAARPGWKKVSAVITGNVVNLDDDIASRWGPRVVDYVQAVAAGVTRVATMSAG